MAESEYTLFKPRQVTPEQKEQGFFEKYPTPFSFIGQKLGIVQPTETQTPTQQESSQYTLFKPRQASEYQQPEQEPNAFEKYVKPITSFGAQTLSFATQELAKGIGATFGLSRNFPRRVIQSFTPRKAPSQWTEEALQNYEDAFDKIKSGSLPQITRGADGKVDIGKEALPTIAAGFYAAVPAVADLIVKTQPLIYNQYTPDSLKNQKFLTEYESLPLKSKILKYPGETLRLMAPSIVGSGLAMLGTGLFTGGAGTGSLLLASATGEDVKSAAIKNGVNPLKAESLGMATAVPIMFLEKFGFDAILGKGMLKNIGLSFGGRILKSATAEAGTEITQEAVQAGIENTFRDVTKDEVKTRLAMAALGGALGGLAFGTTASAFNTILGKVDAKATKNAEARLETSIDKSPEADLIEQGLDYKPTETSVLKQSFVDQMVEDVKQQTDLLVDEQQKESVLKSIDSLSRQEFSTLRDFEVALAKVLPKDIDTKISDTMIGQEFNKVLAAADESTRQYVTERAFEEKIDGKRQPLVQEKVTLISGGESAPTQNILGETVSQLREAIDDIKKEKKGKLTSEDRRSLAGANATVKKLEGFSDMVEEGGEQVAGASVTTTQSPAQMNAQTTPVTRSLTPVRTAGEQRISSLSANVATNAVERKLVDSFESLPTYSKANMKEQAQLATTLVQTDPVRAKRIAMGEEQAPDNILPESIFTAIEQKAVESNDINTLQELATVSTLSLEATAMGQRIRALAERDQYSPVTVFATIQKQREENLKAEGINIERQRNETIKEIKKEVENVTIKVDEWEDFVSKLVC